MKPTFTFDEKVLDNADKFQDDFFKRFKLRHAEKPLQLNDQISKNYLFPTFYGDVTCSQAIFMCDYTKAQKMMLHPSIKPVKMTKGRAVVAFSCYEYRNVLGVAPYNEIAMTIPIMVNPAVNVPVLPLVMNIFSSFGYYVFSMPVTSLENQIRGLKIWGLPKVVQEIDLVEENGFCVTTAKEETGEKYFELRVPVEGVATEFDVRNNLYTRRGNQFLQSETAFKASFQVVKHMNLLFNKGVKPDREYLKLGDSKSGRVLKSLGIEEHPFQLRFARGMSSCFDLPNPNYQSPIKFGE
jgi:hypothetical protein